MTEYSNKELEEALADASRKRLGLDIGGFVGQTNWTLLELNDLRAILDSLLQQGDNWQKTTEDHIRKGDAVRWVREVDDGTILTVEGVADCHYGGGIEGPEGWYSAGDVRLTPTGSPAGVNIKHETLYRIPRKQDPPDPREHRLIIDSDGTLYQSTGGRYMTPGPFGTTIEKYPKELTEWDPVKVVLDTGADHE